MTGRVKIIRVTTEIKAGRKEPTTEVFYECWCDVQSLGTNEKYTALQAGLENTIVFKVRNCKRMKEVRKKVHFRPDSVSVARYRNIKREKHIFVVTRSR
mgnify:CR=1 FL=1